MHSKRFSRWLKLIAATLGLTALVSAGISLPSQAVSAAPTPYCSEGTCWVTFDYTGDYSIWTPPSGISSLHFDVYGAQGGRSGGRGGYVSGDFAAIPSALYVYVGGVGAAGNSVAGGYNGGGTSGSGHADQGSGGGASDIRATTLLADRLVVAGGGGGTGGWIGGVGGAGGLTMASSGTRGAPTGTAGGGGSQTSGGAAGLGVTTGNGSMGNLGFGGMGGTGSVAGGGAGGGGFYGGGGGGSDNLAGGSDGAGGGGGSSFATMALTRSVYHQGGVRTGNGQVVLRYTFAPKVTSFSPTTGVVSTTGSSTFRIVFDQFVYDLDPWDFKVAGTASGCSVASAIGDGYTFEVTITGCANGTVRLSLNPNSVMGASTGPAQETLASSAIDVDSVPATLTLVAPSSPTNASSLTFKLSSQESFVVPDYSAFDVLGSGCYLKSISSTSATTADIKVVGCSNQANVRLVLHAGAITDLAGNASPAIDLSSADVLVDVEAPAVESITAEHTSADIVSYAITFSEPVSGLTLDSFNSSGTGCQLSRLDGHGKTYQLFLTGCAGESRVSLKPFTVYDMAGNLGPIVDSNSEQSSSDITPPTAVITELARTDKTLSPSFEVRFDEMVSGLTIDSFTQAGTAKECTFSLSSVTEGLVYRIDSAYCRSGSLTLTLMALTVQDTQGNNGPVESVNSRPVKIGVAPVSTFGISSLQSLEQSSGEPQSTPQVALPSYTPKVRQAATFPAASTFAIESLKPESWVSIGIAMLALVIAKRPRRRRRA